MYLFVLSKLFSVDASRQGGGRFCTGPVSFLLFFIIICSSFFFCLNFLFSSLCLSLFCSLFFLIIACCFASSPPTPSSNSCCVKKRPRDAYPSSRVIVTAFKPVRLLVLFCAVLLPPTIDDPRRSASQPLFNFSSCLALRLFSKNSFVLFRVHVHRGAVTAAAASGSHDEMLLSTDCFCCCCRC